MNTYKKCPRCDLNYIKESEDLCDVCKKETASSRMYTHTKNGGQSPTTTIPLRKTMPTLSEFGLSQSDIEKYKKQEELFDAAYNSHKKTNEKIGFFISWGIATMLVLVLLLIVLPRPINVWIMITSPITALFFPGLLIMAVTGGFTDFLDKKEEFERRYIDKGLKERYQQYTSALNSYKEYQKKVKRDYWVNMDGLQFEQAVATLYREIGYNAIVTPPTGDGGIDIILKKGDERIAVQCKHHASSVGPNDVRALQGVVAAQGYSWGIFISLNGFTPTVRQEVNSGRIRIELLELRDLIKMVEDL